MSDSGRIRLDGDVIRYRSTTYGAWDLPLSEVRIIGECTNQDGPVVDDYFFCFATGPEMWLEASFYAEGRDAFLRDLGARLGSPLVTGLCHSTDFASRILWPASLAGAPMFSFTPIAPQGLLRRLLGLSQYRQTYSERAAAASHRSPPNRRDHDQ